MRQKGMKYRFNEGLWFFAMLGSFIASLSLSWWFQSSQDYYYGFWYDYFEIGEHIERFAPKNRFIKGLESNSKSDHVRLFSEISDAVHSHGEGLSRISFQYENRMQNLLSKPEILHLQDVANLIDVLTIISILNGILSLFLVILLLNMRTYPSWRNQGVWWIGFIFLHIGTVISIGPEQIFNQLHEWAFPENHHWYFYYQESLMVTLMKAPDLFGGIAFAIGLSGIFLFILYAYILYRLTHRFRKRTII